MSTNEDPVYRIRFAGRRFQGARLPASILPDIEAFRDLLVAFAKSEWRQRNTDRQRVPRGFDNTLQLDLVAIEGGSAVPVLKLSEEGQSKLTGVDSREEVLNVAYDRVMKLIDQVNHDPGFRPVLARDQIGALKRFGSGLREDERIEFVGRRDQRDNVVFFDAHRRKDLMNRIRETYETRYTGVGYLDAVEADGKIEIDTPDYGPITVDVGDRAVSEFDGSLLTDVTLDLTLELDEMDHVLAVRDVHSVDLCERTQEEKAVIKRTFSRLGELIHLAPGWLDGDGAKISASASRQAKFLIVTRPLWFASSGIFPTLERGVQIETRKKTADVTIIIDANGSVSGFAVPDDGDDGDEELKDLSAVVDAMERFTDSEDSTVVE